MLPCHRWWVSPDALAQEMGRRHLIYLCQASLAMAFVRGCLSDSHKTPDYIPRITYYGREAHTSICHWWFVCFGWNGHETNLEGGRYPNEYSDQHFTMKTSLLAESFYVASYWTFAVSLLLLPLCKPLGSGKPREGALEEALQMNFRKDLFLLLLNKLEFNS